MRNNSVSAPVAFARQTDFGASAFHIKFKYILCKWQCCPNGKQFVFFLHPSILDRLLSRRHWVVSCYRCSLKIYNPFEVLRPIRHGGILSTSPVYGRTTSFEQGLHWCRRWLSRWSTESRQTATLLSFGDMWNGVLAIIANSSMRDGIWRRMCCLIQWVHGG